MVFGLAFNLSVKAQTRPDRVPKFIDDLRTVVIRGNHHSLARPELETGRANPLARLDRIVLLLQPDPEQQRDLESLLAAQQDPDSPQYQQWLTPEEFGERFGVSDNDMQAIVGWLESKGLEVERPLDTARRSVTFSGTVAQVESAFHTEFRTYNVHGALHQANATDPSVPEALAGVVAGFVSLHDFHSHPLHYRTEFNSGSVHYLSPADFASIYDVTPLYTAGTDGSGQSIAVVGRSNIKIADIQTFRGQFGLPPNDPNVVLNGSDPGVVAGGEQTEAELDVEWAGAVARKANVQLVVSASTKTTDGITLSAQYIVNHNLAPVVTLSFGSCEAALGSAGNQFWNGLWQQAAAQGMSVFVASGDSGPAECDDPSSATAQSGHSINGLCSSPYSTCVGGTEFSDAADPNSYWSSVMNPVSGGSALGYIPEAAWNSSASAGGSGLWASGGGPSGFYPKPSWQTGTGVPADNHRDVPDVALNSSTHDGYLFCVNNSLAIVGGTSVAAPSFASLMALIVQRQNARQGNANPTIYSIASKQSSAFHDVTAGNNSVPGASGYSAGAGYDLATGLGSPDANVLAGNWRPGSGPVTPVSPSSPAQPPQPTQPTPHPAYCQYQVKVGPITAVNTSGYSASVIITAASGCSWTGVSSASWITLAAPASGSGNGTLKFLVNSNPFPIARSGTIAVAGALITISEAGKR